ncbi:hypothetical protein PCANC_28946, partial [Puccinia coronata f. sp. avenae]
MHRSTCPRQYLQRPIHLKSHRKQPHKEGTMVFCTYDSSTKITVVRMSLRGFTLPQIRRTLDSTFSRQSFNRWVQLFHETHYFDKTNDREWSQKPNGK